MKKVEKNPGEEKLPKNNSKAIKPKPTSDELERIEKAYYDEIGRECLQVECEIGSMEREESENKMYAKRLAKLKLRMKSKRYIIKANYPGVKVEEFDTYDEAKQCLDKYENEDKSDGIYDDYYYSIIDLEVDLFGSKPEKYVPVKDFLEYLGGNLEKE